MKRVKLAVLRLLKATGAFALARRLRGGGVRIICFHGAWLGREGYPGDAMFMAPETFRARIALLKRLGYPVISLDDAVAGLQRGGLPRGAVAITIDDGWYSTYSVMLPELFAAGMPATLYVDSRHLLSRRPVPQMMVRYLAYFASGGTARLGYADHEDAPAEDRLFAATHSAQSAGIAVEPYREGRVFDYMDPEQLAEAHARGLDVQLHTHRHTLGDFAPDTIREEITDNRRELAAVLGCAPDNLRHFCYPSGQTSPGAGAVLAGMGVVSATTTVQGIARPGMDPMFLPRIQDGEQVTEIEFEAELCGLMDLIRTFRR